MHMECDKRKMEKQITHLEVVLGDWQQLPDALLTLSDEWRYLSGGIYVVAYAEVSRILSSEEDALFIRLQEQGAILVGSSRTRHLELKANVTDLPDWAEPPTS